MDTAPSHPWPLALLAVVWVLLFWGFWGRLSRFLERFLAGVALLAVVWVLFFWGIVHGPLLGAYGYLLIEYPVSFIIREAPFIFSWTGLGWLLLVMCVIGAIAGGQASGGDSDMDAIKDSHRRPIKVNKGSARDPNKKHGSKFGD
jgi:hypothetical protein